MEWNKRPASTLSAKKIQGGRHLAHTSMIWALDLMRARGQQRSVRALRTQAHQKDMIHTPR